MKKFIITGAAGFIGARLSEKILSLNNEVIGIDNLNEYYNRKLKLERIKNIEKLINNKWKFLRKDINDLESIENIFCEFKPDIVVNLAAQAGVRYSIDHPHEYIQSNLVGFANILEMSRKYNVDHLVYASSSSVYGANRNLPYDESDSANHPLSLYGATKRSNELMAHTYSHLYGLKATGLRFFTVYGPWGRPDMAPMIFAKSILKNKPININNNGNMKRDFTYIDDIVNAICKCSFKSPYGDINFDFKNPDPSSSNAPHKILNIGNSEPINLLDFINILEKNLNKKAIKKFQPMQAGDVLETAANTSKLEKWINYKPSTNLNDGLKIFSEWFLRTGYVF